jgi:hypothetical protein
MNTSHLTKLLQTITYIPPEQLLQGQQPPDLPVAVVVGDHIILATQANRIKIDQHEYFLIQTSIDIPEEQLEEDLDTPVKEDPS